MRGPTYRGPGRRQSRLLTSEQAFDQEVISTTPGRTRTAFDSVYIPVFHRVLAESLREQTDTSVQSQRSGLPETQRMRVPLFFHRRVDRRLVAPSKVPADQWRPTSSLFENAAGLRRPTASSATCGRRKSINQWGSSLSGEEQKNPKIRKPEGKKKYPRKNIKIFVVSRDRMITTSRTPDTDQVRK